MTDRRAAARVPTPVVECSALPGAAGRLWLKNDGLSHAAYGGNKVRKLERIVEEAKRRGARRILTFGAAGSHHVLTTGLFAREHGLSAAAVLVPQPATAHVIETLRASAGLGVELHATRGYAGVPLALTRAWRRGDYVVPPGASNVHGALGYVDAVGELRAQIEAGALPEPDWIVTAVGSGGTCAGLLAGVVAHGLRSRVLGVAVVGNPLWRRHILRLAERALRDCGIRSTLELASRLEVDTSGIGAGYGHPTAAGLRALETARTSLGLELDTTYTAKAFACVLNRLASPTEAGRKILYLHTLSALSLAPLLVAAPALEALPKALRALVAKPARALDGGTASE